MSSLITAYARSTKFKSMCKFKMHKQNTINVHVHFKLLSRTCPSASTDIGGVKVVVREERLEEESSSEASDGERSGQYELTDMVSLRVRLEHDDRSVVYIMDGTQPVGPIGVCFLQRIINSFIPLGFSRFGGHIRPFPHNGAGAVRGENR